MITDSTGSATRLLIDASGNVGIGMTPFIGGANNNNIQIANGSGPAGFAGTGGGALYVNAGRLFYIGGTGTATLLSPA